MDELGIDEIREMETKEIQRKINELQKRKVAAIADSKPYVTPGEVDAGELGQVKKSIARCKTVLNERGPKQP